MNVASERGDNVACNAALVSEGVSGGEGVSGMHELQEPVLSRSFSPSNIFTVTAQKKCRLSSLLSGL